MERVRLGGTNDGFLEDVTFELNDKMAARAVT